jgi:CDP-glycerol glycerophosphotransferase (TagB/SpsB family)
MKTVFIVISQALLIRNILRSGTLELLKKQGHKVVILILGDSLPEYIKQEFADENVELVAVPNKHQKIGRIHRKLILFTHLLINNNTTNIYFRYSRHYIKKSRAKRLLYLTALHIFSRLQFVKPLVRWIEKAFFQEKKPAIAAHFDKYKPDLVFSTSITAKLDNIFIKESKRRNIPVISMTKSWDNATKMYYRAVPDYFFVQNDTIKDALASLQDFSKDKIFAVGFPQFDWYTRKEIFRTREEHCQKMGLDPKRKIIFFGSQGNWFPHDYRIGQYIHKWIIDNELAEPSQLLIRPHFTNIKENPLDKLRNKPHVIFDDSYRISEVFSDNWDPTESEVIDFVNTLLHCDIAVMVLSTLALDAVCFDKPLINAVFEATYQRGKDVTFAISPTTHYNWIFDTKGTSVAKSAEELKKEINQYLTDSNYKSAERKILKDTLCHQVDGKSSARIAKVIEQLLEKHD